MLKNMKYLIRISRLASKEAIKDLKSKNPIFCSALKQSFTVTNIFYNHVVGYKKSRPDKEIIERLIVINLIPKIAREGIIKEKRENGVFENKIFKNTYKIMLRQWWISFYIILWEETLWDMILLSCFVRDHRKKEQ